MLAGPTPDPGVATGVTDAQKFAVKRQLVLGEGKLGEERVFVKHEVSDDDSLEQTVLGQVLHLVGPVKRKFNCVGRAYRPGSA